MSVLSVNANGGGIVGTSGLFFFLEEAYKLASAVLMYSHHPALAVFSPRNPAILGLLIAAFALVPLILAVIHYAKVRAAIVEAIVVDVVNHSPRRRIQYRSMHTDRYLLALAKRYVAYSVDASRACCIDMPFELGQLFKIFVIHNRRITFTERNQGHNASSVPVCYLMAQ